MKFRYARHTKNLKPITEFYTQVLGLQILGSFENHSDYNGVFLGFQGHDWHIEFTESGKTPHHIPDDDDLMVFYVDSNEQINQIKTIAEQMNIPIVQPKNPFWQMNGIELKDPDNFGIIITIAK